jgi:hypothetical protein
MASAPQVFHGAKPRVEVTPTTGRATLTFDTDRGPIAVRLSGSDFRFFVDSLPQAIQKAERERGVATESSKAKEPR